MINTEFSMLDQVVPDDTTLQQRPPVYQVRKFLKYFEFFFLIFKKQKIEYIFHSLKVFYFQNQT